MAWPLISDNVEALSRLAAGGNLTLAAGEHLTIETSPGGEEYLDVVVPNGKSWAVSVSVSITETNA